MAYSGTRDSGISLTLQHDRNLFGNGNVSKLKHRPTMMPLNISKSSRVYRESLSNSSAL